MAKKENKGIKAPNSLNREPKDSVTDAVKKMKTSVQPNVNGEIKDIVNDILNGNLKKAMSTNFDNVSNTVGLKSKRVNEEEEKELDEKELILGGKSVDDGAGHKTIRNAEDITKAGKEAPAIQENELPVDNKEMPMKKDGKGTEIEQKLEAMGYGIDESVPNEDETGEDEVELDLNSVGYDVSEKEETPASEEIPTEEPIETGEEPTEEPTENGEENGEEIPNSEEIPTEEPSEINIGEIDFDDLSDEDKGEIKSYEEEINAIREKLTCELNTIAESVLPNETKEKLKIQFEMFAEAKAKIIAKKQVASLVEKTNDYMQYVVKEFVEEKSKEIKEAIDASKKIEIYENFKTGVEALYGTKITDINESKKTEEFLINVIAEQKKATETLEQKLNESKDKIKMMECKLIFNESTKNMTVTDREKIANFVESFEYNDSIDFKSKLGLIIESFQNLKRTDEKVTKKSETKVNKLDENKIKKAVDKVKLNENVSEEEMAEIDPNNYKWY